MTSLDTLHLVIYALATYRLSVLVVEDDISAKFRSWCARQGRWLRSLTTCQWCVSVWLGAGTTCLWRFGNSWGQWVCAALATSAVTGFLAEHT